MLGSEEAVNAIIGIMYKVPPATCNMFLCSMRDTWDGDVFILTDDPSFEPPGGSRVLLIPIHSLFCIMRPPRWFPNRTRFFLFRWLVLDAFLRCARDRKCVVQGAPLDSAWVVDLRDTILQDDPFAFDPCGADLAFCAETPTIGESEYCRKWLGRYYGKDAPGKIGDGLMYNAGAVWGTVDGLMSFTDGILEEYRSLLKQGLTVGDFWDDQAILNWLIHLRRINGRSFLNGHGPVLHLAQTPPEDVIQDDDGRIRLRSSALFPAILHQYDRHRGIKTFFEDRLGSTVEPPV